LGWHIQRGHLVFSKSVTPPRIRESFERCDSDLEPVDTGRVSALDQGESGRIGPSPGASAYRSLRLIASATGWNLRKI
jgi:2,5-diketo-D-gluconate reductase A